jgi:hypothetical protein
MPDELKPEEIRHAYWGGTLEGDKILWTHRNIIVFFEEHSLKLKDVLQHIGPIELTHSCGRCGKTGLAISWHPFRSGC